MVARRQDKAKSDIRKKGISPASDDNKSLFIFDVLYFIIKSRTQLKTDAIFI